MLFRSLDGGAQRIAELEAEIERFRNLAAQATHEAQERARTANNEMVKVQRVLEFFDSDSESRAIDLHLDDTTGVDKDSVGKPQAPSSRSSATSNPRQGPTS